MYIFHIIEWNVKNVMYIFHRFWKKSKHSRGEECQIIYFAKIPVILIRKCNVFKKIYTKKVITTIYDFHQSWIVFSNYNNTLLKPYEFNQTSMMKNI